MLAGENFLSGSTPSHRKRSADHVPRSEEVSERYAARAKAERGSSKVGPRADNEDERVEMRAEKDTKTWGRMRAGHNTRVQPCGDPGDVEAGHSPDNAETQGGWSPDKDDERVGLGVDKDDGQACPRADNGDKWVGPRVEKGDGWLGSRVEKGDEQMGPHADKGDGRVESSANKDGVHKACRHFIKH
ncbi:hypothetical protein B0H14DRAFT_2583371 [Mycena olivaceomarginata]|nr:hypothetical protein B0H14DRAFT_2583371 [Mycena olivaceomarginata]